MYGAYRSWRSGKPFRLVRRVAVALVSVARWLGAPTARFHFGRGGFPLLAASHRDGEMQRESHSHVLANVSALPAFALTRGELPAVFVHEEVNAVDVSVLAVRDPVLSIKG
jgi:hypothetical protein